MARIMVARELSTAQLVELRNKIKQDLLNFAVRETGKQPGEFLVRDALPLEDFTFNSEKACNQTAQTAATWAKDWSKELPKSKFVAFYGVCNPVDVAPVIIAAKFQVGANGQSTRDAINFSRMRAEDTCKAYFEPILYKGGETIYVSLYPEANVSQYGEQIEFFALVAEPYGEVISAPSR